MDHIDFDTEQSLFVAPESLSSEQLAMAMSIPMQRRLIRKPLPDVPPGQANRTGEQSLIFARTGLARQHGVTLEASCRQAREAAAEEQRQLDWWPAPRSALPAKVDGEGDREPRVYGRLDSLYEAHLLRIIEASLDASDRHSECLARTIVDALKQCLDTLATPEALGALQRSYSFLWRVEALVRSNEQLDCSKAPKGGVRWPRLGAWRGSISTNANGSNTEARKKKRDLALQLLGNAFWMAGVGVGEGAGLGMGMEEDEPPAHSDSASEKTASKRTSGSAPRLLVKSSIPTVALHVGDENGAVSERSSDEAVGATTKTPQEPTPDRASVLTTRLAMQLKNAENSSKQPSAPPSAPLVRPQPKPARNNDEGHMAVSKVCLDFVPELDDGDDGDGGTGRGLRRRRSGTITLRSERRQQNMSTMSTRSDYTVRLADGGRREVRIIWKPNQFTGSPLFLNPLSSDAEGREHLHEAKGDHQLQLIGGTFVVELGRDNEEEENVLRNVLDIGLYAASAMMLESALLHDNGLETDDEAQQSEVPAESPNESSEAQSDGSPSLAQPPSMSSAAPAEKQSRWPTNLWGIIGHSSHDQPQHSLGFSKSKTIDGSSKRGEKRASGYSSKLGKMISSFTGAKRPSTADQESISEDAIKEQSSAATSNVERESDNVTHEQTLPHKPAPPTSVSPHVPEASADSLGTFEQGDYLEHLLSHQSLSLNVLEGLDVSLPFAKQQEQPSTPSDSKRASMQSRNSFNDAETRASGSTLSVSRSLASSTKSARSTSGSSQAESNVSVPPSKGSVFSAAAEASDSWDDKSRREVQFYQRAGSSRDVSLGQAVEEMAAKAIVLNKGDKKVKDGGGDGAEVKSASPRTYRVAQYLHGHDRISILASVTQPMEVPSVPASNQADINAVAKASQMGQDIARSAVLLAEHVNHAHQPSEQAADDGSPESIGIVMWSANIRTGDESAMKSMSNCTYLASYGAFIQAILSHPKFVADKYDMVRMFRLGGITLKFQVQPIVVFDLLVDGPVVVKSKAKDEGEEHLNDEKVDDARQVATEAEDARIFKRTRIEIQDFYASVKRHISTLEHVFVARELDERGNTIKPPAASSRASILTVHTDTDASLDGSTQAESLISSLSSEGPLALLSGLKGSFRKAEFGLYDSLKTVRASSVNDVRKRFYDRARSAKNRLSAWEQKHLSRQEVQRLGRPDYLEPEYFEQDKHAFPGSRFLIREEEPLSIIAYTLSSRDFDEEMRRSEQKHANVLDWRTSVVAPSTESQLSSSNASTNTGTTASTATLSSVDTLDPDLDEEFHTPVPLCVNMKRKKRVKDAGILSLTLKRVSSNISSQSGTGGKETDDEGKGEGSLHITDSSAGGRDDDLVTPTASRMMGTKFDTVSSNNDLFRAQIAHVGARASLGSMFEGQSTAPPTPSEEKDDASLSNASTVGDTAAKEATPTPAQNAFARRVVSNPVIDGLQSAPRLPVSPHIKHSITSGHTKISCISWFAHDFGKLRGRWNIEDEFVKSMSRCKSWNMMGGKSKSGFYLTHDGKWIAKQLLNVWSVDEKEAFLEFAPAYLRYMMNSAANDCPTLLVKIAGVYTVKIKNVKTGETKLKMSVQVLENVFAADTGESIRFDIKGIRDRRIAGTKRDHGDEEERAPVWWDAEWLDCFQARAYVPERDKQLFRRALRNDLAFLTASNVMDYSLLIGAHDGGGASEGSEDDSNRVRPAFRVRLVDYLGEFTLVKQLESSSKKAIKSQAPTIIPPREYALRFGSAVETYFIPCPDGPLTTL